MRVAGLLSCPWREAKRRSFVKCVGQVWGDQAQIGAFSLSAGFIETPNPQGGLEEAHSQQAHRPRHSLCSASLGLGYRLKTLPYPQPPSTRSGASSCSLALGPSPDLSVGKFPPDWLSPGHWQPAGLSLGRMGLLGWAWLIGLSSHPTSGLAARPAGPTTGTSISTSTAPDLNPSRERCGVPFSCCVRDPAVSAPLARAGPQRAGTVWNQPTP